MDAVHQIYGDRTIDQKGLIPLAEPMNIPNYSDDQDIPGLKRRSKDDDAPHPGWGHLETYINRLVMNQFHKDAVAGPLNDMRPRDGEEDREVGERV